MPPSGINIVLKPGGDETAHLTVSLKNVLVNDTLRRCAELSHHKLTHTGLSFHLTPATTK
ncbi:hypothetical protein [Prosthecobacter sp.]|uniref:hypothetical protein n=1 Tax=Prosthecobacter sp. TaxID=1965333 RepID=UPI002487AA87|nr:hypothetical protein [Prosthecobacter sp.]MDI1311894.1 hypothetical protein [Prosthecobacter sp.]